MSPAKRSGIRRHRIETRVLSAGQNDREAMMAVVAETSLSQTLARARAYVAEVELHALKALQAAGVPIEGRGLVEVIAEGQRDYEPDTEVGFIVRILERFRDAGAALAIAERSDDAQAVHAFLAGASLAKARGDWVVEFGLSKPIVSGLKSSGSGRHGGLRKAAIERPRIQNEQAGWKKQAQALWAKHPDWSASAVAIAIAKRTHRSPHTIRRHIKKPEQLGATPPTD